MVRISGKDLVKIFGTRSVFWMIALLVFVNCTTPGPEGVLQGGGRVDDGITAATFNFQANNCGASLDPPVSVSGKFNYNDLKNSPPIQISGDVTQALICDPVSGPSFDPGTQTCNFQQLQQCEVGGYILLFNYQERKKGGATGNGSACLMDNGRGRNSSGPDEAEIHLSGFGGYSKFGEMNGNAQVMFCN